MSIAFWILGFVAHTFYFFCWYIAFFSGMMLFGEMRNFLSSQISKVICAITFVLAVGCCITSLTQPSTGHYEYSLQGSEWVDDTD